MTNGEKYKTAQERAEAFEKFCIPREVCDGCELDCDKAEKPSYCQFAWLNLEAEEEKPLPCPFCDCAVNPHRVDSDDYNCQCVACSYVSTNMPTREYAIADHNRVANDVRESNGK